MKKLSEIYVPLKYKILSIQLVIIILASAFFLFLTQLAFYQDKAFFVMDLNFALLDGAYHSIANDLRTRLETIKQRGEHTYLEYKLGKNGTENLPDDAIGMQIFRIRPQGLEPLAVRENAVLWKKLGLPDDFRAALQAKRPLSVDTVSPARRLALLNRSFEVKLARGLRSLPIVTIVLFGEADGSPIAIAADFTADFLRKALGKSEIAELFLIHRNGMLLSHPSEEVSTTFADQSYYPGVVQQLQSTVFSKESKEIEANNRHYFSNVLDTGLDDVYVVSMISKAAAFRSLTGLLRRILVGSLLIVYLAAILSIIAASRITKNLTVLQDAAEEIGSGNLEPRLDVFSNDEVARVSDRMQWMARRISRLLSETADKARMENELKTAQIVQSTLMSKYSVQSDAFELESFYRPATECSGDIFDSYLHGSQLTFLIGDATGHGVPAAIVTAIVKGALSAVGRSSGTTLPPPQRFLEILNGIIYECCRGKLLMTMCVVQLNCDTGEMLIANAGHEVPLHIPLKDVQAAEKRKPSLIQQVFARGERLGYAEECAFETVEVKLEAGDALCLYTDGITDAKNGQGEMWGERTLKKTLAQAGDRSATEIRDTVSNAVASHNEGQPQEDDFTFTLLRWLGPGLEITAPRKKASGEET